MGNLKIHPRQSTGAIKQMLAFALVLMSCLMQDATAKQRPSAAALQQARDYTLAACIMSRYTETALASEAEGWAGGIIENGNLAAENYAALANLAKTAPPPGTTQNGISMKLQSCVDFVHSKTFTFRASEILRKR